MKFFVFLFLSVFILGVNVSFAESIDTSQPGYVDHGFIFELPSGEHEGDDTHASTIVQMVNGDFLAAWFQGTEEGNDDVKIYTSKGTESTQNKWEWAEPEMTAKGAYGFSTESPCWNPVLFCPSFPDSTGKRPLMLFYKVGPNTGLWDPKVKISYNNGEDWSDHETLGSMTRGPVKNKPIEINGDTLLYGGSTEFLGCRINYSWSDIDFQNWGESVSYSIFEKFTDIPFGFIGQSIQPTLLDHGNGKIQSLSRNNLLDFYNFFGLSPKGCIGEQWSEDYGKTWTEIETTNLRHPDSGIDALTLKDGRFLLVFNNSYVERARLEVAISTDGINWKHAFTIEPDEVGDYSYPAVIQSEDNLVHITYSYQKRQIMHVVLDPDKFELTPLESATDFENNISKTMI